MSSNRILQPNIVDVFPTKILITENHELASKLLPLCNKYTEITDTNLLEIPNYPSTLRNEGLSKLINEEPIVLEAFDYIQKLVEEYSKSINVSWQMDCEKYGFFSSMHRHAYLRRHRHPRCTFAGLIYLETDKDVPPLILHNPNPFDAGTIRIDAIQGRVLLWPSWLEHELDMKLNDNPRKVFTFNV